MASKILIKNKLDDKLDLKDVVNYLNSKIELYFGDSLIGIFTKEELKKTEYINDRIHVIETDSEPTICVYLSNFNRK